MPGTAGYSETLTSWLLIGWGGEGEGEGRHHSCPAQYALDERPEEDARQLHQAPPSSCIHKFLGLKSGSRCTHLTFGLL